MTNQAHVLLPTIGVDELTKIVMAKRLRCEEETAVAASLASTTHPGGLDHTKNAKSVEKVEWTLEQRNQAIAITWPKGTER